MDREYVQMIFNKLHTIPEPGHKEYKTSEFIANEKLPGFTIKT